MYNQHALDRLPKLVKGLMKVIERQNAKPPVVTIDIGMNTYIKFENKKKSLSWPMLSDFYYPLLWQPLKYCIKPTAHTVYTYSVSKLPFANTKRNKLKRYKSKQNANKSKSTTTVC